jgi:hypothetical protein
MSNIDYEELIRSPLDALEAEPSSGWGWSGFGLVAGGLIGLALALMLRGPSESEAAVAVPTSAVAPAIAEVIYPTYPDGYTEIAPGLGARIGELITDDDSITIAVDTVVAREGDVLAPIWPVGGVWWLESSSGAAAESSRVVLGRFSPGVFSVEFPAEPFGGERAFTVARLAERWDQREMSGSTKLPFTGEPFVADGSASVVVDEEVTLILTAVELGRFLGKIEWKLQGPELGGRVNVTAALLDAAGTEIGRYEAFPDLLTPSSEGTRKVFWNQAFSVDQTGAETLVLEYSVSVVEVTPAAVTFDLSGLSIGR